MIDSKSKDYSIRKDSNFIKLLSGVFVTICKVKSHVWECQFNCVLNYVFLRKGAGEVNSTVLLTEFKQIAIFSQLLWSKHVPMDPTRVQSLLYLIFFSYLRSTT